MSDQTGFIMCPHCGARLPIAKVNRPGRRPLNIDVKIICDTLQACRDIALAAKELGCSRGYIYKVLGEHGLKPRDIIRRQILDGEK